MSQPESPPAAADTTLRPDVLIVGGGVQGLWLLNDLHRGGYTALLLERRELGGEQTCHSHLYLHQGHMYREASLAKRLRETTALWQQWLAQGGARRCTSASYFGFQNPTDADLRVSLWDSLGLVYRDVSAVPGLAPLAAVDRQRVRRVLESPECCIDGVSLVGGLRRDVDEHISRIDRVQRIEVRTGGQRGGPERVERVEVVRPDGGRWTFEPRALVLAAGAGNMALLELATGGDRGLLQRVQGAQQIRKAHMLVIRGPAGLLAPLSGVFPDLGGLFIVARTPPGEVVWLISDDNSAPLSDAEDWMEHDERWWLAGVLPALYDLAPALADLTFRRRLEWGVYAAPKAEGRAMGAVPSEGRVERFRLENLWALWPTKLTLAPAVSRDVARELGHLLGTPRPRGPLPPAWAGARVPPATAPERWQKVPLMSWDNFSRWCAADQQSGDDHE